MLWEDTADPNQAGKLATASTSDPDDSPLPATVRVRASIPKTVTLQKKFRSGTLAGTAEKVSTWRLFCCAVVDDMLTGAHLQVQTST